MGRKKINRLNIFCEISKLGGGTSSFSYYDDPRENRKRFFDQMTVG